MRKYLISMGCDENKRKRRLLVPCLQHPGDLLAAGGTVLAWGEAPLQPHPSALLAHPSAPQPHPSDRPCMRLSQEHDEGEGQGSRGPNQVCVCAADIACRPAVASCAVRTPSTVFPYAFPQAFD